MEKKNNLKKGNYEEENQANDELLLKFINEE